MKVYIVVVTYCEDAVNDGVFADEDSANDRVARILAAIDELHARQSVYIDREKNTVTDSFAYRRATDEFCAGCTPELGEVGKRLPETIGVDVQVHEVRGT